ncbi:hypothetical protein ILUMI_17909, partial [Ignelater luminosus]
MKILPLIICYTIIVDVLSLATIQRDSPGIRFTVGKVSLGTGYLTLASSLPQKSGNSNNNYYVNKPVLPYASTSTGIKVWKRKKRSYKHYLLPSVKSAILEQHTTTQNFQNLNKHKKYSRNIIKEVDKKNFVGIDVLPTISNIYTMSSSNNSLLDKFLLSTLYNQKQFREEAIGTSKQSPLITQNTSKAKTHLTTI